eukprot:210594_1
MPMMMMIVIRRRLIMMETINLFQSPTACDADSDVIIVIGINDAVEALTYSATSKSTTNPLTAALTIRCHRLRTRVCRQINIGPLLWLITIGCNHRTRDDGSIDFAITNT